MKTSTRAIRNPWAVGALGALLGLALSGPAAAGPAAGDDSSARIEAALAGDHRAPGHSGRDRYRHPRETLLFFGLQPDMTVVEVSPGRGWYTEVLAPVLRDSGQLYVAGFGPPDAGLPPYLARIQAAFEQKLAEHPDRYDQVRLSSLRPPAGAEIAPPGSADLVLTFRNVHNWLDNGSAGEVFAAMFRALKPGGVLGVVEHRAAPGTALADMIESGYVTEDKVIELAEAAGFQFLARSEINANPADSRDHPAGVWTLSPSLRLGEQDRERYLAIGESDRMTLKFRKP